MPFEFPVKNERLGLASASDFKKIAGSPISYWVSQGVFSAIKNSISASDVSSSRAGMTSGNNDKFTRQWFEVSQKLIKTDAENWQDAITSTIKPTTIRIFYGINKHLAFFCL